MNILSTSFKQLAVQVTMQNLMVFFFVFLFVFSSQAQETQQGYISDDLFIYMHAGPGTNYRILGTINAGAQIQITGKSSNEYSEIVDDKQRISWVESKYVTNQQGLRFIVAELNSKLASGNAYSTQLDGEINELKSTVERLNNEKSSVDIEFKAIKQQLEQAQAQVRDQDTNIKKQWFFNGAIVLGIGLIFGLILPKFFTRRRTNMDSWG